MKILSFIEDIAYNGKHSYRWTCICHLSLYFFSLIALHILKSKEILFFKIYQTETLIQFTYCLIIHKTEA